jgi:tripartite-type tricarboxylate transporter receptor subunit TctC
VSTPKRSPLMPNVPTFLEEGFPDMNIYIWSGLSAPAGTPDAIVQRLQAEFAKALKTQSIVEKWRETDSEPLPFSTPEFLNFVRTDAKRWSEAVRISGFKASE